VKHYLGTLGCMFASGDACTEGKATLGLTTKVIV
jgi:hypothetical protein